MLSSKMFHLVKEDGFHERKTNKTKNKKYFLLRKKIQPKKPALVWQGTEKENSLLGRCSILGKVFPRPAIFYITFCKDNLLKPFFFYKNRVVIPTFCEGADLNAHCEHTSSGTRPPIEYMHHFSWLLDPHQS